VAAVLLEVDLEFEHIFADGGEHCFEHHQFVAQRAVYFGDAQLLVLEAYHVINVLVDQLFKLAKHLL